MKIKIEICDLNRTGRHSASYSIFEEKNGGLSYEMRKTITGEFDTQDEACINAQTILSKQFGEEIEFIFDLPKKA